MVSHADSQPSDDWVAEYCVDPDAAAGNLIPVPAQLLIDLARKPKKQGGKR